MPKKPKAQRNRGQIIPRGDDKWLLRAYRGSTVNPTTGKRRRLYANKTFQGTASAAEKELTKLCGAVDTDTYVAPARTTLVDYLTGSKVVADVPMDYALVKGWLGGRRDISAKTRLDYCQQMRCHVLPDLGHLKLQQLTRQRIQDLATGLEASVSNRTIEYVLTILKAALRQAVRDGLLVKNPAQDVVIPPREHREFPTLTADQQGHLIRTTAGTFWGVLWGLLLTTGMRPQEALALQWDDVIEDSRSIRIVRAVTFTGVGPTKTKGSKRSIPVPQETWEALQAHKKRQLRAGDLRELVFPAPGGVPFHLSGVRRKWHSALKAAGLPRVRVYDARHSHFTTLLEGNVHPKIVSERAGHSSIRITMDRYSHVSQTMQQQAAEVTGLLLFKRA